MSRDSLGVRPLLGRSLLLTVCGVVAVGACALLHALLTLDRGVVTGGPALLALLVLVVGRLAVHVPGYPATVSVSEFFVFILTLLFGPAPAVLTVGLDGLFASLAAKRRCLHRTLFNVAERRFLLGRTITSAQRGCHLPNARSLAIR